MPTDPSPAQILQVGMGFWASKALLSAVELGLFTELAGGLKTGLEMERALGLHPRATFDFLNALVALASLHRRLEHHKAVNFRPDLVFPMRSGRKGCKYLYLRAADLEYLTVEIEMYRDGWSGKATSLRRLAGRYASRRGFSPLAPSPRLTYMRLTFLDIVRRRGWSRGRGRRGRVLVLSRRAPWRTSLK